MTIIEKGPGSNLASQLVVTLYWEHALGWKRYEGVKPRDRGTYFTQSAIAQKAICNRSAVIYCLWAIAMHTRGVFFRGVAYDA